MNILSHLILTFIVLSFLHRLVHSDLDVLCARKKGTCQNTGETSCNGHYVDGCCGGRTHRKCCVPGRRPDDSLRRKCLKLGGGCVDQRKSKCSGQYLTGHCGGDHNMKCCIPKKKRQSPDFSDACLQCICQVEGCERLVDRCRHDVYSDSCGPFQIKQEYWNDCHRPGSNWRDCTTTMDCSASCVSAYVHHYGAKCARKKKLRSQATCEDFARVHNGGPDGCRDRGTSGYWSKVQACCVKAGGC